MNQRTPLGSELKQVCHRCRSAEELYRSSCKHLNLCVNCGKSMAANGSMCPLCGTPITRLIREYNVRANFNSDADHFIGRFVNGLPDFKKNENKWFSHKGPQGQQFPYSLEECKYKSLLLEEETSHLRYIGVPEDSGSVSTYYFLVLQGKELVAVPIDLWYNFNKVRPSKQVTKETGEEMKNSADDVNKRHMRNVSDREAAFGGRWWRKTTIVDDKEAKVSDRGEEDSDGPRGADLEDYDMDIGDDDPEHDPDKQEDLVTGSPAPPAIEPYDDEYETGEGGEGLTESGKELKKLLKRLKLDD